MVDDALHLFAVPVAGVGEQHRGQFVDATAASFALGRVEHPLEMSQLGADGLLLAGQNDFRAALVTACAL